MVCRSNVSIMDESSCSGCGLCSFVCPMRCVEMKENERGFILPAVGAVVCLAAIVAGYINWFYWATHPPIPEEEPVIKPPSACPVEHPGMGKEPKIAVNPKTKVYPGPPKPRMPRPGIIRR